MSWQSGIGTVCLEVTHWLGGESKELGLMKLEVIYYRNM